MKKLKKGLSLLLVLAMVFSLATTAFAGWDNSNYEDADQITQDEAVAVMTGLGIIEGNENTGLLEPTGNYTRAQAAKVLTYMLLGPANAEALPNTSTKYTDVPVGEWYTGVISYLTEQGIIEGFGDGTFRPDENVTQAQWLKMLLCAMGYDADEAGMGDNANWAVNATALALKGKLVNAADLKLDWNREAAIYFAFKAVEKNVNLVDNTKTAPFAVDVVTEGADDRQNGNDQFGRPTYFYSTTDSVDDAYAKGTLEPVLIYENQSVSADTLAKDLGLTTQKRNTSAKFTVYEDGVLAETTADNQVAKPAVLDTAIDDKVGTLGSTVEVYETENSTKSKPDYVIVVINTYAAQLGDGDVHEAEGETAASIDLPDGLTYETADFEEGDVVLYTKANDVVVSVEKAPSITGTVTAVAKDKSYIRVDGVKTLVADHAVASYTGDVIDVTDEAATIYTDTYGNVVLVEVADPSGEGTTTTAKNYAYILDRVATKASGASAFASAKAATAQAQIIDLATGEIKVVDETLKVVGGKYYYQGIDCSAGTDEVDDVESGDSTTIGSIVEYTVADDGTYTLTEASAVNDSTVTLTKGEADVGEKLATSATKLTVVEYDADFDGETIKVNTYTGIDNFPESVTATQNLSVIEVDAESGLITAIYVIDPSADFAESATVNYAVYIGEGEKVGADTYYEFIVNGESVSYPRTDQNVLRAGDVVNLTVTDGKAAAEPIIDDNNETSNESSCEVIESATVKYVDTTYVNVNDATLGDKTLYFADSYKIIDGTYATGKTAVDASYAETTIKKGDTITVYLNDTVKNNGKIAFIVKVNATPSDES